MCLRDIHHPRNRFILTEISHRPLMLTFVFFHLFQAVNRHVVSIAEDSLLLAWTLRVKSYFFGFKRTFSQLFLVLSPLGKR